MVTCWIAAVVCGWGSVVSAMLESLFYCWYAQLSPGPCFTVSPGMLLGNQSFDLSNKATDSS